MAQLRAGGAPADVIALVAGQEGDGDGDFEIWPENADALRAFLFAGTQWHVVAGMGGVVWMGLRYDAIERAFRLWPPADERESWAGVQIMEREALRVMNEEVGKRGDR